MTTPPSSDPLVLALPKGRILDDVLPILEKAGIVPEADFFAKASRKLRFGTNRPDLDIIRVRAFDAATFIAFGAAHIGVVGFDVLEEFGYEDLYSPLDLKIGPCELWMAVEANQEAAIRAENTGHIRVATKYPNITKRHYAARGIQTDCVKLNGAMEIAPSLGLADRIVDLVSTGSTLQANRLVKVEKLLDITSRLVVSRVAFKTRSAEITAVMNSVRKALGHDVSA